MDESSHRNWDIGVKIAAAVVAVFTFLHGIDRYATEQRELAQSTILAEQQSRKSAFVTELFRRDLGIYGEIAGTAAEIAVSTGDPTRFDHATQVYEKLYWGHVTLVENPELAGAMDAMRNAIRNYRDGLTAVGDQRPEEQLKRRAHDVSQAARRAAQLRLKALAEVR